MSAGGRAHQEPADRVIVMAGSAGAFEALTALLGQLPEDLSAAVIVLVHQPSGGLPGWSATLARHSRLPVNEAIERVPATAGRVHTAAPGYHLLVERDGCFSLSLDPRVSWVRPSADVLLATVADCWGPRAAAVVLSGANEDGGAGARQLAAEGGLVLVQDPEEAPFAAMPNAALRAEGARAVKRAAIPGLLRQWGE